MKNKSNYHSSFFIHDTLFNHSLLLCLFNNQFRSTSWVDVCIWHPLQFIFPAISDSLPHPVLSVANFTHGQLSMHSLGKFIILAFLLCLLVHHTLGISTWVKIRRKRDVFYVSKTYHFHVDLPFIASSERFLYPLALMCLVILIATLFKVNICVFAMSWYFS